VLCQPTFLNSEPEHSDRYLVDNVVAVHEQLIRGRVRLFGVHSARDYFAVIKQGACLWHNTKHVR